MLRSRSSGGGGGGGSSSSSSSSSSGGGGDDGDTGAVGSSGSSPSRVYIGLITNLQYAIFARHILAGFSVLNFCREADTTSLLCVQFMNYTQCTRVKLLFFFSVHCKVT